MENENIAQLVLIHKIMERIHRPDIQTKFYNKFAILTLV